MSKFWHRLRRFLTQKVLHTNDTPHTIARGAAIATFVAFLPVMGVQTVIAVGLAALARANKAICVPIVWITNPLTGLPIYGACFVLGHWIMGSPPKADKAAALSELERHQATSLLDPAYWVEWCSRLATIGTELWVGCTIVGVIGAAIAYVAAHRGVTAYRERRRRRILQRTLLRSVGAMAQGIPQAGSD